MIAGRGVDALGNPWPDRPASWVALPGRGEPRPSDVDPAWDHCEVCQDLLAYCPEWQKRWPDVSQHQQREPRGWG